MPRLKVYTDQELAEHKKESQRRYRDRNKQKIAAYMKAYRLKLVNKLRKAELYRQHRKELLINKT